HGRRRPQADRARAPRERGDRGLLQEALDRGVDPRDPVARLVGRGSGLTDRVVARAGPGWLPASGALDRLAEPAEGHADELVAHRLALAHLLERKVQAVVAILDDVDGRPPPGLLHGLPEQLDAAEAVLAP